MDRYEFLSLSWCTYYLLELLSACKAPTLFYYCFISAQIVLVYITFSNAYPLTLHTVAIPLILLSPPPLYTQIYAQQT